MCVGFEPKTWSGRHDSNVRPLPPHGSRPRLEDSTLNLRLFVFGRLCWPLVAFVLAIGERIRERF